MKKGRVMLVGAVGSGKTSLVKALSKAEKPVTKTQSIEYHPYSIDTPGEFLENPLFHRALFATSLEAEKVLLVQDATRSNSGFPPGFAKGFPKPTIGVVTKIDHPGALAAQARRILQGLGVSGPVVEVSSWTGVGIGELRQLLEWDSHI